MTDPTNLSLADLAAAVVRLGAHRELQCILDADHRVIVNSYGADLDTLLAAANRLPAVVAECERLTERIAELEGALEILAGSLAHEYGNRERIKTIRALLHQKVTFHDA